MYRNVSRRVWRFGGHELDEACIELRRDGAQIHVEPLVFDLLVVLAESEGALVSRRELFDRLWSGVAVTQASLARLVCDARRQLGDDGRRQTMIRTVHGRGYQLAVPVSCRGLRDCG